jgi:hypothetical protein
MGCACVCTRVQVLSTFTPCSAGTPGAVCVYRGLRLRIGLHCDGRDSLATATVNRASGRVVYGGALP